MIPTHDDRDEAELRALFDASVPEPSAPMLTKLSAKAGDVPEHASRAPHWLPRWTWAPGFAGLAVAAGALAVTLSGWLAVPASDADSARSARGVTLEATPVVELPKVAPSESGRGVASHQAAPNERRRGPARPETTDSDGASLPVDLIAGMSGDWDPEGSFGSEAEFDALQGPAAEADLDAWLYATGELLEGG